MTTLALIAAYLLIVAFNFWTLVGYWLSKFGDLWVDDLIFLGVLSLCGPFALPLALGIHLRRLITRITGEEFWSRRVWTRKR